MTDPLDEYTEKGQSKVSLLLLLPNMLTVAAICAGMSAIRFGVQGNFTLAVQLIFAACILVGLDGRLARRLGCDSKMGAELDSLADFLNFGVAPSLVIYFWALQDMSRAGWMSVLVYAVCVVVRLARFNVTSKSDEDNHDSSFFTGVPSPAAALLVMFPMYLTFGFSDEPILSDVVICAYMILIGMLTISRIQTWSFKTTRVSRENVKYFLVGFAFAGAAFLTYAWVTLALICVGYVAIVLWVLVTKRPV